MKFVALPVGNGDAFYAETDDRFRVLVDGGRSKKELPRMLHGYVRARGVDVVVCTHNDADHANGLIGFFEAGLRCRELWLPATWLEAVMRLPEDPWDTISLLLGQLRKASREAFVEMGNERAESQEIHWRNVFFNVFERWSARDREHAELAPEPEGALSLNDHLVWATLASVEEHLELLAEMPLWFWSWKARWVCAPFDRLALVERSCLTVVRDVRRLLALVWLASARGIPVRCFAHDPANAGIRGVANHCPLRPLSAKQTHFLEPTRPPKSAGEFWRFAFLTAVNRQSLVLFLDAGDGRPGVLFTGDSDLKGVDVGNVPPWSVVTAPHHGSHENRLVYTSIKEPMVWVRSDGYSKKRPCAEFLQAQGRRFCTLCRNSGNPKQAIRLHLKRNSWVRRQTRLCACR